jgi:hypothetical protein
MWGPHVSDSMAPRMALGNVTESQSCEDRVVGCVSEGVGMGPRHAVIKEVMFSAGYKGEGTLVFPWAFQ